MKRLALLAGIALVVLLLVAGCTAPAGPATPAATTPAPTTANAPGTIPAADRQLVPGPTQVPPDYLATAFDVEKDSVFAVLTVTYRDGLGQYLTQSSHVRVTLSNGTIAEGDIQPVVGAAFQTQGTKAKDRVEVYVRYSDGSVYKVIDQLVPFQNINPP